MTTPRPVFEVSIGLGGFFTNETPLEILIEAHDKQGRVVGEALHSPPGQPGHGYVDPASGRERRGDPAPERGVRRQVGGQGTQPHQTD